MSDASCDCKVPADTLHCNKCDHVFCGSCEVEFRHTEDCDVSKAPKKLCPKCFSADLYRKMTTKQKNDAGLF